MTTILLVDDDPMITEPLARTLSAYGHTVLIADNGRVGLEMALQHRPNIVILDVLMPEMDGWDVCRALRAQSGVPILMLTALGEEVDRILGLELGADDYLTKPFSTRELVVRIKALLRRVELERVANQDNILAGGAITLNLDRREVRKHGELLIVRHKEFELLYLLMSRGGEVVTRADIFDLVWGTDWLGDTRTLDVHIRWLRTKIEEDSKNPRLIQTVRGVGYQFIK